MRAIARDPGINWIFADGEFRSQGEGLRKFVPLEFVCGFILFASFAHAQQLDIAIGGSTVWSSQNSTASEAFLPPPLKGGTYPDATLQYLNESNRGINVEGAFRYHEAVYNNFQFYRPILYDANYVFAHPFAKKWIGDFMGGAGGETLLFYEHGTCAPSGGCRAYVNSTHFLFHAGFALRYYAWRNLFVRAEGHYYFIPNNYQFHSDSLFRIGASVGYTFGKR